MKDLFSQYVLNRRYKWRITQKWLPALWSLLAVSKSPTKFTKRYLLPPLDRLATTTTTTDSAVAVAASLDYTAPIITTYTNDPKSAQRWVDDHLMIASRSTTTSTSLVQVVGFDLESAPNLPWRKDTLYIGPATIQLAVHDAALVIHIAQDDYDDNDGGGPLLYDMLTFAHSILDDDSLLLAGVGMDQDLVELYRWEGNQDGKLVPERPLRIDLGGIGATTGNAVGLRRLAASVLNVDIPKSRQLARSPWASAPLSNKEIAYAARDAWTAVAVLHRLNELDPERFAPDVLCEAIRNLDEETERAGKVVSIADMSEQMALRKKLRDEWKFLLEQKKVGELSEAGLEEMEVLEKRIRDLAPIKPLVFEVETSLGISL